MTPVISPNPIISLPLIINPKRILMESTERLSDLLATALGPEITELLKDDSVSEIRLNADVSCPDICPQYESRS